MAGEDHDEDRHHQYLVQISLVNQGREQYKRDSMGNLK